jgi:lipopolysaccharide biosynthesis glycosyltransferase
LKTALCFTPDLLFFRPAVCTAASLIAQGDGGAFDIFMVCEPGDVAPGFDKIAPELRARIQLLTVDFSTLDEGLESKGRFSKAVFRRLFLDRILPADYSRYISIDSDMLIARPGLERLATIELGEYPLAAAYDMIYLMDHKGGALAREFKAYRRSLGLDLQTPYFNAGLMVVDRAAWRAADYSARAAAALRETPGRFPFMEQSALNSLIAGQFAPLSPRCNFMGDFFLTGLEPSLRPIVLHFVNSPKPWNYREWRGEARFARIYRDWFAASPWPDWADADGADLARARKPAMTPTRRRFAASLAEFLSSTHFVDG